MSDDAAFLAAIRAAPTDDTPRLVYADWLDEQGRPGGDFLRTECELAAVDPADDYRWALLNRMRVASLDLDDAWVEAVSRVSVDEINLRVREIQSWLRRRVTVAELLARMAEWDKSSEPPRSLWARVRGLFQRPAADPAPQPGGPRVRAMREWVAAHMRAGDELWEYDAAGDTWANLCGEMGYAIVRKGKVIEFEMLLMN